MEFIWIDDDNSREEAAKNMERSLRVNITFVNVHDKEIDQELSRVLEKSEKPDLVIMDHVLSQLASGPIRKGSTAATRIKEVWSECPVISVTAAIQNHDNKSEHVDTRQRDAYENMFPADHISEHYKTIKSIAEGFRLLNENRPTNLEDVLDKLGCPDQEKSRLIKVLPNEIKLKQNFDDRSLLIEIYKWCSSVLFSRPGFLYDELWAATLLGLSEEGFRSVSKDFQRALYSGVFKDESKPRWWKSLLIQILSEKFDDIGMPWKIGRNLVDREDLYSRDYAMGEDFPETVAAEDQTVSAVWYPMKLKYTEPHPGYENMLFFDELRIMKGAN